MELGENLKICCLVTLAILSLFQPIVKGALITTTETSLDGKGEVVDSNEKGNSKTPEIYEMYIKTNVTNRYAVTSITSKVRNLATEAKEAIFFVVLPEKAFISEFIMETGGKSYKAYVKEKEEAKNIYTNAVRGGLSAAHVEVSARDSNKFTVSLNLEAESKAVFKLTYEELLRRQKGMYEVVLNIHPGQIVPEMEVEVVIDETAPLTFVRTPSLRSGNEIEKLREDLKPNAEIIKINETSSVVKFNPDIEQQKKFATAFNGKETEGLKGQFVVEYDVERNITGGEILLNDGYFVHFFAPEGLENMPKQVVFVLDISGSMYGEKVKQLVKAMVHILDDLQPYDSFSIVAFDTTVNVWNKGSGWIDLNLGYNSAYGELEKILMQKEIPSSIPATAENIAEAKSFVKTIGPRSLTNIIGGLEVGLFIVKKAQQNSSEYHQPLMVFLTDGQANVGISSSDAIRKSIAKLNPKDKQTPIFSLSFGIGADKDFLRKLSDDNLGFSRHIFDAADASLQLQDFYQLISSPIMKDVSFRYTKNATVTTKHDFPIFFRGSEFVVAGKIPKDPKNEYLIEGWRPGGAIKMKPKIVEPVQSLERLWAFLTVQQILEKRKVVDDKIELTKKAVDLALKYSFVTPVTSLVVVKPNATDAVNTENAYNKIHTSRGLGNAGQFHNPLPTQPSNIIPFRADSLGNVGRFHNSFSMHSMSTYQPRVQNYIPHKRTHLRLKSGKSHRGGSKRHRPINRHSISLSVPHFSGNRNRLMYSFPPPASPVHNGFGEPMQTFEKLQKLDDSVLAPPPNSSLPVDLPELRNQEWFKSISNKYAIRIPKAETYRLATNETVVAKQPCARTVLHKPGNCTLIHQCPSAFKFLTDLPTFLRFFCPIEKYAGICCDV